MATMSIEQQRAFARDQGAVGANAHLLARHGSKFLVRRAHNLPLEVEGDRYVYLVVSGGLFLESQLADGRRLIVNTYYPGDFVVPDPTVRLPKERLVVMKSGEVVRVRRRVFDTALDDAADLARQFRRALQLRSMREEVHAVVLGRLNGDERMASYLIEAGRQYGTDVDGCVDIELPMLRSEMADYLALNSDTLSRLVTRLKSERIVRFIGRHRAVVEDWSQLVARTPIADLLLAAYPEAARQVQDAASER
ncbi:MAG TPA: Crp/Fnr family transcriptional regulator [Hyphomicrobiaceae bacterium]|nr:Crp/Fnr family transcriptional regulator [Hyphomicrobiaceae bacterium]